MGTSWKKDSKTGRLIELTAQMESVIKRREAYIKDNAADILVEIEEERLNNRRESEEFLVQVGKETGLFITARHARRCLAITAAITRHYINQDELKAALEHGTSLSAIGQLMEGEAPKKGEFRKWLPLLAKRGQVTKMRNRARIT